MSETTTAPVIRAERPNPEWVRGKCPTCGQPLVSNRYYEPGRLFRIVVWECWQSLGDVPTCDYRRVP